MADFLSSRSSRLVFQVKNCTIHIIDDSVFEPEEELQVHLGTPLGDHWSGAMVGANDVAAVTISNDEDGKRNDTSVFTVRLKYHCILFNHN